MIDEVLLDMVDAMVFWDRRIITNRRLIRDYPNPHRIRVWDAQIEIYEDCIKRVWERYQKRVQELGSVC